MLTDFFAASALIQARLTEKIPALKAVYSAFDISEIRSSERAVAMPSADVIPLPDGIKVVSQIGNVANVEQTWGIVLRSRPPGDGIHGDLALAEIGTLVMQAFSALQGWRPSPEFKALAFVSPTDKLYEYIGEIEFPLAFVTGFTMVAS